MLIADRYEKTIALGLGGMGEIWEGTDTRLNRGVAIKLIRPDQHGDSVSARRRFYREARILARLRHPGIPALYDFGADGEDLFIVMELVPDAACLRDLIGERGSDLLPVPWVAAIGAQLSAALTAAHEAGLIHRDLTPANIMLTRGGMVKILDFGVATAGNVTDLSEITRPGEVPGTLLYSAPELDGHTKADVRSDLYSVGCVLYELLAGRRVFQDESITVELASRETDDPPGFAAIRADVPPPLGQIILGLLNRTPADRPATATALFAGLLPYVHALPPLPGFHDPSADQPTRMFAMALSALLR